MIRMTCLECGHTGRYKTRALAEHHFARHSCDLRNQRMAARRRRIAREKSEGPRRDCQHPNANHRHGTTAAYILDKCRCRECRDARATTERHRKRQKLYGRPGNLTDAQPAREHLQALMAAGMGLKTIIATSGIAHGSLYPILYDKGATDPRNRRPRRRRITRDLERRILAVQLQLAPGTRVDGTGTHRRIHALIAIGWTQTELARCANWSGVQNFSAQLVHGTGDVTAATRDKVAALYDQLWNQPQTGYGAKRARATAARYGFAPPLAWDDDTIDQPDAQPDLGADWRARRDQRVDLDGILDLIAIEPDIRLHAAAHRLGVQPDTIWTTLKRTGRQDIYTRLTRPDDAPLHRTA